MHILPSGTQMTPDTLSELIKQHMALQPHYEELRKEYEAEHAILDARKKDASKPDNRVVANFAQYVVDTLNGFFIGVPVKQSHEIAAAADYLERLRVYTNLDDHNAELVKLGEIYGHAFELIYLDDTEICVSHLPPTQAFAVYDDSIVRHQIYGVRYFKDADGVLRGSFSDAFTVTHFADNDGFTFEAPEPHYFGAVPLHEYVFNEERKGVFERILTLCRAYDKAISEKANDVDYYADAYLCVLGAELDDPTMKNLRDSRIINLSGSGAENVIVQFLQKPDADATQEHLIDRLERLIFTLSMVANINDEEFGASSGVSLQYKLQPMRNLANTMERKLTALFNRRYRMIFQHPVSRMPKDAWVGVRYKFTRNLPANLLEESQIAGNLAGITSEETQLEVLSCVENAKDELRKKEAEAETKVQPFTRFAVQDGGDADVLGAEAGAALAGA